MANITQEDNLKSGYADWSEKIAFFNAKTLVNDPHIKDKLNSEQQLSEHINPDEINYSF